MANKQLKDLLDSFWSSLNGLTVAQVQYQIEERRQSVEPIVGVTQLQKIRNSSLLRLLCYELIIFANEKGSQKRSTISMNSSESECSQRSATDMTNIRQLKQLLKNIGRKNKAQISEYKIAKFQFKSLVRATHNIEKSLMEQDNKKPKDYKNQDMEGAQAMIEQLQYLLKKKQGRIKELNSELEQNFNDKDELERQIEAFEQKNIELEEKVRLLELECQRFKDQFQQYKSEKQQQLLFGTFGGQKIGLPSWQNQKVKGQDKINNVSSQTQADNQNELLNSTKLLAQYCRSPQQYLQAQTPKKQIRCDRKTVKKSNSTLIEDNIVEEEQNLLESMRIFDTKIQKSKISVFCNDDHFLERILVAQAGFIDRAVKSIIR